MDPHSNGDWIELSHPLNQNTVKVPFLPSPELRSIDDASLQATAITIATHVGTHIEAPCHLRDGGKGIDEYPADRWITRGRVCELEVDPLERIDLDQLQSQVKPEPGDALMIRTGWEDRVGTDEYYEQPYLSEEAAKWVVERDVSWIGIDSPSPEMPVQLREEPFDYPVHATLLDNDVPIAEHLTNLASVAGSALDVIALPLSYVGTDAAHARIVARQR